MQYSDFLAGCPNGCRRSRLWEVFTDGLKWISDFAGPFTEIVDVTCSDKNEWRPGGHILLNVDGDDGCILHEVFHSKYDPCIFHDGDSDEKWGDAFCDAFRYFGSRKMHLCDPWLKKIEGFTGRTFDEIMEESHDRNHDKAYGYPASRIIKKVGSEWKEFPEYWKRLCCYRRKAQGCGILNLTFSYDIKSGKPIATENHA
jgi:hypothetical protein